MIPRNVRTPARAKRPSRLAKPITGSPTRLYKEVASAVKTEPTPTRMQQWVPWEDYDLASVRPGDRGRLAARRRYSTRAGAPGSRQASGRRTPSALAVVAKMRAPSAERTGLEPATPDRTSDQEIKSLLVKVLRDLADREGFEPSQQAGSGCHSPLKAMSAATDTRIFSPPLGESAERCLAVTGVRIPSGTPLGACDP